MHSHHETSETRGWRNNWFVKNVLAEIPIFGAIFHTSNVPHALHNAGKSTAMLIGGSTGMMMDMLLTKDEMESMAITITKSTVNMAVGMMVGTVAYNALYSAGNFAYQKCSTKPQTPLSPLPEPPDQPLLQNDGFENSGDDNKHRHALN